MGLGDEVARTDFLRLQPGVVGDRAYREWQHFVLRADGLDLLVNLSVLLVRDDDDPVGWGRPDVRATLLVHADDRWHGAVLRCPDAALRPGRIDADFGPVSLGFDPAEGYRLNLDAEDDPGLTGTLRLVPATRPLLVRDVRLPGGSRVHWCVVPRLLVDGWVGIAGRDIPLRHALAYHDHNWGDWGADYSWEWGYALPDHAQGGPWSAASFRLGDRARGMTARQSLLLWEGARLRRVFRDAAVEVNTHGRGPSIAHTLPPIGALARPGDAADVPGRWTMRSAEGLAAGPDDALALTATPQALARIVVPEPDGTDVVAIHEAACAMDVRGHLGRQEVALGGRGFLESAW